MENKELTAVEWLINEMHKKEQGLINKSYNHLFDEAKQKEKEQMHKCASFWRGKENEIEKKYFDEYYKEKYGE